MSQNFPVPIATSNGATQVISDLSNSLLAVASSFSGTSAPSDPVPLVGQPWFDSNAQRGLITPNGGASARWEPNGYLVITRTTTSVGNVGTGMDDLQSLTLPAGFLANDGAAVRIQAFGRYANNANGKSARLAFGATVLVAQDADSYDNQIWVAEAVVFRTGAATQLAFATIQTFGPLPNSVGTRTTPSATLSGAVTIKTQGEGTSNDDVLSDVLIVTALR